MLGNRKLIVNDYCEVKDLLAPYIDGTVGAFLADQVEPGAIYLLSWWNFIETPVEIKIAAEQKNAIIFLSNPLEGSEVLKGQCYSISDLILNKKIFLIGGGDMEPEYTCLRHDWFATKILNYQQNVEVIEKSKQIYYNISKPYKFLFLNGLLRPHRKYLLERWSRNNLLEQSIWSNLSSQITSSSSELSYLVDGRNVIFNPILPKYLDAKYEIDRYVPNINPQVTIDNSAYIKNTLFNDEWGDVYLKLNPYVDTYFSVVTETVFEYPYSFRTEKIWKPIAIGHPWIAVANKGFYQDLRNIGFKTFEGIIDESFDLIDDNQQRIERIAQVVEDLCQQNLENFLISCRDICEYNQRRFVEFVVDERNKFPTRLQEFINQNSN